MNQKVLLNTLRNYLKNVAEKDLYIHMSHVQLIKNICLWSSELSKITLYLNEWKLSMFTEYTFVWTNLPRSFLAVLWYYLPGFATIIIGRVGWYICIQLTIFRLLCYTYGLYRIKILPAGIISAIFCTSILTKASLDQTVSFM